MRLLEPVAAVAAIGLASVLAYAAVAKLRDQDRTAADFASLGLLGDRVLARVIPIVELITAAALLAVPSWGGAVAFALLAGFTAVLTTVVRSGRVATCACFGGTSGDPVSIRHLVRNGGLLAVAALASTLDGTPFAAF